MVLLVDDLIEIFWLSAFQPFDELFIYLKVFPGKPGQLFEVNACYRFFF